MLDAKGTLVEATKLPWYEFYITLVRRSPKRPPALTPRLFCKTEGDRIFCGPHAHGRYTSEAVKSDDAVFLLATGSGEAPHNAMIAELLGNQHRGPIVSVTCVRYRKDLAYLNEHRALEKLFPQYRYLALTTREQENVDTTHPTFVGRRYLQDYFASGALERDAGVSVNATNSHVFLCGSPSMIGSSKERPTSGSHGPTAVSGMVELLEERGLRVDHPHRPGNIHFETYW
jgi:ferredoxin--NADP+ reductase